jgi:hypothetical protein
MGSEGASPTRTTGSILSKVPAGKDIGEFVELKFKAGWSQHLIVPCSPPD